MAQEDCKMDEAFTFTMNDADLRGRMSQSVLFQSKGTKAVWDFDAVRQQMSANADGSVKKSLDLQATIDKRIAMEDAHSVDDGEDLNQLNGDENEDEE